MTQQLTDADLQARQHEPSGADPVRGIAPIGSVLAWFGVAEQLEVEWPGWVIADGTFEVNDGTPPDLQGKVIVGVSGSFALGATGGAQTHGHTDELDHDHNHDGSALTNNSPNHVFTANHTTGDAAIVFDTNHALGFASYSHVNGAVTGSHSHDHEAKNYVTVQAYGSGSQIFAWDYGSGGIYADTGSGGTGAHGFTEPDPHQVLNPPAHTAHLALVAHVVSGHGITQPAGHSDHGAHAAINHMPPYAALYLIMRVA